MHNRVAIYDPLRRALSSISLLGNVVFMSIIGLTLGLLVVLAPPVALATTIGVVFLAVTAYAGPPVIPAAIVSALPWLVFFPNVLPQTAMTAMAVFAVLLLAVPPMIRNLPTGAAAAGAVLFGLAALLQFALIRNLDQLLEAGRYLSFAALVSAFSTGPGRQLFATIGRPVFLSAVAATTVQFIVAVGLGINVNSYYDLGERLGFASSPHQAALVGLVVAGTAYSTTGSSRIRILGMATGAITAIATGVRTAFAAVVAMGAMASIRGSHVKVAATLVAMAILLATTNLGEPLQERLSGQSSARSSKVTNIVNSRTDIWGPALRGWSGTNPGELVFGSGFRSIASFTKTGTGTQFGGHSDVVSVLVQLGLVGFVGWCLLWYSLARASEWSIVILPLAVFALLNGSLNYLESWILAFVLAAWVIRGSPGWSIQSVQATTNP